MIIRLKRKPKTRENTGQVFPFLFHDHLHLSLEGSLQGGPELINKQGNDRLVIVQYLWTFHMSYVCVIKSICIYIHNMYALYILLYMYAILFIYILLVYIYC